MLAELFFFIIIIVYVFGVIGLELFAVHSNEPDENYFQQYNCGIVSYISVIMYHNMLSWYSAGGKTYSSCDSANGFWKNFLP